MLFNLILRKEPYQSLKLKSRCCMAVVSSWRELFG